MPEPDLCVYAMKRYVDKRRWLNLWTVLLWIFGVTIVVFCSIAVLLFLRDTSLPGALTVLGTVVNGAGIAWVVRQRSVAEREERGAFREFSAECRGRRGQRQQPSGIQLQTAISSMPSDAELRALAWRSLFSSADVDRILG